MWPIVYRILRCMKGGEKGRRIRLKRDGILKLRGISWYALFKCYGL